MITIIEDGMEYEFKMVENSECLGCIFQGKPCKTKVCRCAEVLLGEGSAICTSAKKITRKPHVYHAWDRHNADRLRGKVIEYNDGNSGSDWKRGILVSIDDTGSPFVIASQGHSIMIREIPTRKLTWREIKAQYPELGDVELVEVSNE